MSYKIFPDENFIQTVRDLTSKAIEEAENELPAQKEVRVVMQYTENEFVRDSMGGSSGYTVDDSTMFITVDTNAPQWKEAVRSTVIHEYNHVVWHQIHEKDGGNLRLSEIIVMEGLAQCFEEYFVGKPPVYATAVSEEEAKHAWEYAKEHLAESELEWWPKLAFRVEEKFPLWAGYTMAYLMIKQKIEEFGGPWSELMKKPTEEWLAGGFPQ